MVDEESTALLNEHQPRQQNGYQTLFIQNERNRSRAVSEVMICN